MRSFPRALAAIGTTAALAAGCAVRATPYRFAGPMVAGVELAPPIWSTGGGRDPRGAARDGDGDRDGDGATARARAGASASSASAASRGDDRRGDRGDDRRASAASHARDPRAGGPPPRGLDVHAASAALAELEGTAAARIDLAALPAPHRAPRPRAGQPAAALAALAPGARLGVAEARALTGARDGRDPVAFALDLRARVAGDTWDAADGPALVAAAAARGRCADPPPRAGADGPLRPGALLVFDRAVAGKPASLVAVVVAVDDRGVAAMMFLAAGVIRLGFVDPSHPALRHDPDGRPRNSFLRHREEEPPDGTRFLAGELLAHVIPPP